MKLRVKLGRESKTIHLPEKTPSSVSLSELAQEVSAQFELENYNFQLSLNNQDALTGSEQKLSDFSLVSGDLLHIIGPDLPVREPQVSAPHRPRRQLLGTYSSQSNPSFLRDGSASTSRSASAVDNAGSFMVDVHSGTWRPSRSDMELSSVGGYNAEESLAKVNRFMLEPLVVRESTSTRVPILLEQLYASATCATQTEALWVAVHALMVEAGFSPLQCNEVTQMPESWKRPGFYTCSYNYSVSHDVSTTCVLSGVTLGASIAVHGIPKTETGFKTETVQLNSTHFVRDLTDDVPSVYRSLDKLSHQIKDTICMPLINELVTAAGYRERQGLLSLPWEVTLRMLTLLDAHSLCSLTQTCQDMRAACQDKMVWRHCYIRDFGRPTDTSLERQWYQLYKERYEQLKAVEEQRRLMFIDQTWPSRPDHPFHPFHPFPFPPNVIGGDYDLNPAGLPPPFGGGRGGPPFHLPGHGSIGLGGRGLEHFSVNPLQPGRRGNMTGSPLQDPFGGGGFI